MAVTIKDIANTLGLSPSTVSRALRDHPHINDKTKEAVKEVARYLDYRVNIAASSLRQKRTRIIGVIVPDIATYFFSAVISGIQKVAQKSGYQIIICQTNESYESEVEYVKSLSANLTDGLLVSLSTDTTNFDHFHQFKESGCPLVFFDRVYDGLLVPKVETMDYEGAFRATEHLIKTGKKNIAHIAGPKNLKNAVARFKGYLAAMEKNGLPVYEKFVVQSDWYLQKGKDHVRKLLSAKRRPDAIFAANDIMGVEAIQMIKEIGLSIPEDVAVVGFGDELISKISEPSLTTVDHRPDQIGRLAAKLLIAELEGEYVASNSEIVKNRLVIRKSTVKDSQNKI